MVEQYDQFRRHPHFITLRPAAIKRLVAHSKVDDKV